MQILHKICRISNLLPSDWRFYANYKHQTRRTSCTGRDLNAYNNEKIDRTGEKKAGTVKKDAHITNCKKWKTFFDGMLLNDIALTLNFEHEHTHRCGKTRTTTRIDYIFPNGMTKQKFLISKISKTFRVTTAGSDDHSNLTLIIGEEIEIEEILGVWRLNNHNIRFYCTVRLQSEKLWHRKTTTSGLFKRNLLERENHRKKEKRNISGESWNKTFRKWS